MYKIIKIKAKSFFKRLKSQNGQILTTLAILGIAALGASLLAKRQWKKRKIG